MCIPIIAMMGCYSNIRITSFGLFLNSFAISTSLIDVNNADLQYLTTFFDFTSDFYHINLFLPVFYSKFLQTHGAVFLKEKIDKFQIKSAFHWDSYLQQDSPNELEVFLKTFPKKISYSWTFSKKNKPDEIMSLQTFQYAVENSRNMKMQDLINNIILFGQLKYKDEFALQHYRCLTEQVNFTKVHYFHHLIQSLRITYEQEKLLILIINKEQRKQLMSFYMFLNGIMIKTVPIFQHTNLQSFLGHSCSQALLPIVRISQSSTETLQRISNLPPTKVDLQQTQMDSQDAQKSLIVQKKIKRKMNLQKRLQSARKNSESNIVNQLFAYLIHEQRSKKLLERAICLLGRHPTLNDRIARLFYYIVRLINFKRGRKYSNRDTIKDYYTPKQLLRHFPGMEERLAQVSILSLEEFCRLFRICTHAFFRTLSVTAILTSKRISNVAKGDHLRRRHQILEALKNPRQ